MGFAVGKPLLPLLGRDTACAFEVESFWLNRNVGSSPTVHSHVVRSGIQEIACSEKGSSQPLSLV